MKTCIECGQAKDGAEFRRNARSADGRNNRCKVCFKVKDASYRKANPEKIAAIRSKWLGAHPGREKELFELRYLTYAPVARARSAEYYLANKPACLTAMREYRLSNQSEWTERIRVSKEKKPQLYAEIHRISIQNRRARKLESEGNLTPGLSERLFKLQRGACPCCKQPLGHDYHMDHIMPLARGGSNTDDNIQLLRQRCNNQKHSKHPVDFMQSRGFLL